MFERNARPSRLHQRELRPAPGLPLPARPFKTFIDKRLRRKALTGSRLSRAAWRACLIVVWLAAGAPREAGAEAVFYACDITRLIVATGKTSSTRRFMLQIELDERYGQLKFNDGARWGPAQVDVLKPDSVQGSLGPLQFNLDRRTGRLSRYLGGGGRSLLDTGLCIAEKG